jgi:hypothetical protein
VIVHHHPDKVPELDIYSLQCNLNSLLDRYAIILPMLEKIMRKLHRPIELSASSIMVAYKSKSGSWRGFVYPYNITTEADSKDLAHIALTEMTEVYEEGLRKYDFPAHLKSRPLSDEEDREVFNRLAVESIVRQGKVSNPNLYAESRTVSC